MLTVLEDSESLNLSGIQELNIQRPILKYTTLKWLELFRANFDP
jgi:hypothetical protein